MSQKPKMGRDFQGFWVVRLDTLSQMVKVLVAAGLALLLGALMPSRLAGLNPMLATRDVAGYGQAMAQQPSSPSVVAISVGQAYERTRISIGLNASLGYRLTVAQSPDRLILDMPTVNWAIHRENLPQPGGVVRSVRYGHQNQQISRVIFDLFEPVAVANALVLDQSGRQQVALEIELKPLSLINAVSDAGNAATFAATQPLSSTASSMGPNANLISVTDLLAPNASEAASTLPVQSVDRMPPVPALRPPIPAQVIARRIVVLDPGHGGKDPGATKNGIREKDLTLATALEIRAALEATGRYDVFLTRDSDTYIKLRERYEIGRSHQADLFISIHADANPRRSARGASVYTLSDEASDAEAAALANRENKSDMIAGLPVSERSEGLMSILLDLAQRETLNSSAQAAEIFSEELQKSWITIDPPHRYAGFAVLKAPDMPSLLLEMGFVTNAADADMLRTPSSRKPLVGGIVDAIDRYFATPLQ